MLNLTRKLSLPLAALLLAVGCASTSSGARPGGDAHDDDAHPTKPAKPLPQVMPASIKGAVNSTEKLFACMEYNHITLLADTDRGDYDAVLARLGELKTAESLCADLVRQMLEGFEPAVLEFEAEWAFYTTYFALTTEVFTEHNPQTFCRHLGQTVQAARVAQRQARIYHQWLSREVEASETSHPYLETMLARATEKVSGLTIAARELDTQYKRECK